MGDFSSGFHDFLTILGFAGLIWTIVWIQNLGSARGGGAATEKFSDTRAEARRIVREYEEDANAATQRMVRDAEHEIGARFAHRLGSSRDVDVSLTFKR